MPFTEDFILPCFQVGLSFFHLPAPKDNFTFRVPSPNSFVVCWFFFTSISFVKFSVEPKSFFHLFVRRIPSFCSSPATLKSVSYLLFHKHFLLLYILWGVGFPYLPVQDISVSVLSWLTHNPDFEFRQGKTIFLLQNHHCPSQWLRSKAQVYGRSPAAIVGSNPTGGIDVCLLCCVLPCRVLCDGLITRPEESYRLWCVAVCVIETPSMRSQTSINSDWTREIASLEGTSSRKGVYKLDSQPASISAYRIPLLWLLIKGEKKKHYSWSEAYPASYLLKVYLFTLPIVKWPVIVKVPFRSHTHLCGICVGLSSTGIVCSHITSFSPHVCLHEYIILICSIAWAI